MKLQSPVISFTINPDRFDYEDMLQLLIEIPATDRELNQRFNSVEPYKSRFIAIFQEISKVNLIHIMLSSQKLISKSNQQVIDDIYQFFNMHIQLPARVNTESDFLSVLNRFQTLFNSQRRVYDDYNDDIKVMLLKQIATRIYFYLHHHVFDNIWYSLGHFVARLLSLCTCLAPILIDFYVKGDPPTEEQISQKKKAYSYAAAITVVSKISRNIVDILVLHFLGYTLMSLKGIFQAIWQPLNSTYDLYAISFLAIWIGYIYAAIAVLLTTFGLKILFDFLRLPNAVKLFRVLND